MPGSRPIVPTCRVEQGRLNTICRYCEVPGKTEGDDLCSTKVNADGADSAEETAVTTTTGPDTQERLTVTTDLQAACRNFQMVCLGTGLLESV